MKSKKTPGPKSGKTSAKPVEKSAKVPAKSSKSTVTSKKKVSKKVSKKTSKPAVKSDPKAKPKTKPNSKVETKKVAVKKVAVKKTGALKKPSRTLRPKVFEQTPVAREFGFPVDAPELPKGYGRDRLVLMTQDPDYLFSYWEINPAQLATKESEKRDNQKYQEAIKLNWAARSLFEENFVHLPVSLDARRWYLRVPFPGLSYQVEIGWLGSKGHFISILESNESESPESWDITRRRLKDAGEVLAYTSSISKQMGSSERVKIDETIFTFKDWNPASLTSSKMNGKSKKPKPSSR